MKSFDEVDVRRPALAKTYLARLAPQAKAVGRLTVYADPWLHQTAPLDAITHALEESLDPLFADFLLRRKRI